MRMKRPPLSTISSFPSVRRRIAESFGCTPWMDRHELPEGVVPVDLVRLQKGLQLEAFRKRD